MMLIIFHQKMANNNENKNFIDRFYKEKIT